MVAALQLARVLSQDPSNYSVNVMFLSTQTPAITVRVGLPGPADGIRIKQPPLPTRGSYGVVGFLNDDNRSAIWLCSVYSQFIDAITSDTDPTTEYHSHLSGYYEMLDQNGHYVESFPDGTSLVVSASAVKPETFRHVVDAAQNRQTIPFTDADRVPNPPSPFYYTLKLASGAVFQFAPDGTCSLLSPATIHIGGLLETLFRLMDERMIAVFNGHTHSGVQSGSGNTAPPNQTLSVGAQTTTVTFAG